MLGRYRSVVAWMVLAACGEPLPDGSVDAPDEQGAYAVGHQSFDAIDLVRDGRTLPVEVWYPVEASVAVDFEATSYPLAAGIGLASDHAVDNAPVAADGPHPLLVFSHGYGGITTQSVELMEALASHGFVVVAPEHIGNSQSDFSDGFDAAAANRVPDVTFVIDTMIARGRDPQDAFEGTIDEDAMGVVGHSFGGMTALGSAAGWAGALPDPRVKAIAPISAVVVGALQSDERDSESAGFAPEQLQDVRIPVMLIGGTEDTNVPIENNDVAADNLTAAPAVYNVRVLGATHTHFASVCPIGDMLIEMGLDQDSWPLLGAEALLGPYEEACSEEALDIEVAIRLSNLYTVAFFRLHLLGESGYSAYLTPRYAATEDFVEMTRVEQ